MIRSQQIATSVHVGYYCSILDTVAYGMSRLLLVVATGNFFRLVSWYAAMGLYLHVYVRSDRCIPQTGELPASVTFNSPSSVVGVVRHRLETMLKKSRTTFIICSRFNSETLLNLS